MQGAVLCGGKSTRMNSDKAMLKQANSTWAEVAIEKLFKLNLPVVLSVNADQHTQYQQLFPADRLIADDETLKIRGPLLGTLSVHLRFPSEDLFVLACDMPLMEQQMLSRLADIAKQHPASDAYLFTNDGEAEPLCGIYRAKGLAHIMQLYKEQKLEKHSVKFMLEHINTFTTALTYEEKKCFNNINTHAELNGLLEKISFKNQH